MNILDEEVFSVIMAIIVISSILSAGTIIREGFYRDSFSAIGLLNKDCLLGDYPDKALVNGTIELCIFIYNHEGKPILYKVLYKVGFNNTIPSNTTPSIEPIIREFYSILNHNSNTTFKVNIQVNPPRSIKDGETLALIFELWRLNPGNKQWEYTGRWVHLYIKAYKVPLE